MAKGPKPKVTPAITERIAREMALGLSLESAAQRCGVASRTAHQWHSNGKAGKRPYVAFFAAIQKAESDREQRLLAIVDAACKPDKQGKISWQAAAWKLERLHPDRWARPAQRIVLDPTRLEVSGPDKGPIELGKGDLRRVSDEDLASLLAISARARPQ